LARLPPDAAWGVAEIGMNHAGEIAPLARLARPHVAVITNVERAHIGHLGSIEAIADEKAAILDGLEPGGIAVLPGDSPLLARLTRGPAKLFGTGTNAQARLLAAEPDATGTTVRIALCGTEVALRLAAPGRHMAMNATAALLASLAAGGTLAPAVAALERFAPLTGRGARQTIRVAGGEAILLDESYNASAVAVRAALAVLKLQPASRRLAVLGDMLELGDAGPGEHLGLAPDIAASADLMFACGPLMRLPFAAIPAAQRGAHADTSAALAPMVAGAVRAGDAVLVKGSLGSRMAVITQALRAEPV
jgi:UDP-N-acetylmuramoyl-tripeptide--D-alanyl-D-alanine ligase